MEQTTRPSVVLQSEPPADPRAVRPFGPLNAPDGIGPACPHFEDTGEQALLRAMLAAGVREAQGWVDSSIARPSARPALVVEARAWLRSTDVRYGTAAFCCEQLRIDHEALVSRAAWDGALADRLRKFGHQGIKPGSRHVGRRAA